ncbi:hypothetical protein [Micromonospora siamensis]|uniref:hypothetical protein n=1 Tax=Micromonospora siamensis TaxID=299152 RepID=UPI000B5AE167|nr:hypothetical protein [Micromonospora siamensis]
MPDHLALPAPWWDLRNGGAAEQRQITALTDELIRETSPGHPLYEAAFVVAGRSQARDDVLLEVGDRWALVHVTWSGKAETPPRPRCVILATARDVDRALAAG